MVRKSFAVASVAGLLGVVGLNAASGCGGTIILPDGADGGGPPATTDARYVPPRPPGQPPEPPEPPIDVIDCPSSSPISAADIEKQFTWLPPAAIQSACTQQNIDALKALFASAPGAGVTFAQIKTTLGPTCASCAFSPVAGPTWQLFVEEGGGAIPNQVGSCFAQLGGADCGKKRFEFETCIDLACADCDPDRGTTACQQKATKGACRDITTAYASACPNEADLVETCGTIFASLAISCAGGADAGIDASSP
jgi:hypothetical protein